MRLAIFFFSCFMILISSQAKADTEIFVNDRLGIRVKVKFRRDYIKVKHLSERNWDRYRLVAPGTFDNFKGERIFLKGANKFVWRSRRFGEQITFSRLVNSTEYHHLNGIDEIPRRLQPNAFTSENLEGTWFNKGLRKELLLISTRDGFKLRLKESKEWYSFTKIEDGLFRDKNGNTYKLLSAKELLWIDVKKSKRIKIQKISDTVQWN